MSGEAPTQGAPRPDVPVKAEAKPQNPPEMGKSEVNALGSAFKIERVKGWFNREKQLQGIARIAKAYGEARDTAKSGNTEDQLTPEQKAAGETLMNRYSTVKYAEAQGEQQGTLESSLSSEQKYLIDSIRGQVLEHHAIDTQPENGQYGEGQHTDIVVRKDENGHLVVSVVTGNRGEFDISQDGTEITPKDATKPLTVEVVQYDHDPVKGVLEVASPNDDLRDQSIIEPPRPRYATETPAQYRAFLESEEAKTDALEGATGRVDSIVSEAQSNAYVMTLTPLEIPGILGEESTSVKVLDIQAKDPPPTPEERKKQNDRVFAEFGKLRAEGNYDPNEVPTLYAGNELYREVADRMRFKDAKPYEEKQENADGKEKPKQQVLVEASVGGLTREAQLQLAQDAGIKASSYDELEFRLARGSENSAISADQISDAAETQTLTEAAVKRERNTYKFEDLVTDESVDRALLLYAVDPTQFDGVKDADDLLAQVDQELRQMAEAEGEERPAYQVARDNFRTVLSRHLSGEEPTSLDTTDQSESVNQATPTTPEEQRRNQLVEDRVAQLRDRLYPLPPEDAARAITFGGDIDTYEKYRAAVGAALQRGEFNDVADQTSRIINEVVDTRLNAILAMEEGEAKIAAVEALQKQFGDAEEGPIKFRMQALDGIYPASPEVAIGRMDFSNTRAANASELYSQMEKRARDDKGEISDERRKAMDERMTEVFNQEVRALRDLNSDARKVALASLREHFKGYGDEDSPIQLTLAGLEGRDPEPLTDERFMSELQGADRTKLDELHAREDLTPLQRSLLEARRQNQEASPEEQTLQTTDAIATFGTTVFENAAQMRTAFNEMLGRGINLDEDQRKRIEDQIRAREQEEQRSAETALQLRIAQAQFGVLASISPELAERVKAAVVA